MRNSIRSNKNTMRNYMMSNNYIFKIHFQLRAIIKFRFIVIIINFF